MRNHLSSIRLFSVAGALAAAQLVAGCQSPPAPGAGVAAPSGESAESAGVFCAEGSSCAEGSTAASETANAAVDGSVAPDPVAEGTATPDSNGSAAAEGQVAAAEPAVPAVVAPQLPRGWASVAEGDLTPDEVARAERAAAAMRSVGGQMMQRVVSVAAEQGYPAAIEVCSNEALGFAQAAQEEFDLRIGRTSTRLRNPSNEVPLWATPHIAAQATASAPMGEFLRGPEGQLGVLKPIMLGAVCANCHGTQDVMATGVREALALRYPRDQAIGYREGELRGWFWMEVAAN